MVATTPLRPKSSTEVVDSGFGIREESVLYHRQGARKHQGKFGLLCGVGLVGVYQGYASHVLECPGGVKDHERIMHEII